MLLASKGSFEGIVNTHVDDHCPVEVLQLEIIDRAGGEHSRVVDENVNTPIISRTDVFSMLRKSPNKPKTTSATLELVKEARRGCYENSELDDASYSIELAQMLLGRSEDVQSRSAGGTCPA